MGMDIKIMAKSSVSSAGVFSVKWSLVDVKYIVLISIWFLIAKIVSESIFGIVCEVICSEVYDQC